MIIHVNTKSADYWAGDTLSSGVDPLVVNKLIIYTRTKFCIYARRASHNRSHPRCMFA